MERQDREKNLKNLKKNVWIARLKFLKKISLLIDNQNFCQTFNFLKKIPKKSQ